MFHAVNVKQTNEAIHRGYRWRVSAILDCLKFFPQAKRRSACFKVKFTKNLAPNGSYLASLEDLHFHKPRGKNNSYIT